MNDTQAEPDLSDGPFAEYKESYDGKCRGEIARMNPALYERLRRTGQLEFVPKKQYVDPLAAYESQYSGLTRGQLRHIDPALYKRLRTNGQIHEIATKKRIILAGIDEYRAKYKGLTRGELKKIDGSLYNRMRADNALGDVPEDVLAYRKLQSAQTFYVEISGKREMFETDPAAFAFLSKSVFMRDMKTIPQLEFAEEQALFCHLEEIRSGLEWLLARDATAREVILGEMSNVANGKTPRRLLRTWDQIDMSEFRNYWNALEGEDPRKLCTRLMKRFPPDDRLVERAASIASNTMMNDAIESMKKLKSHIVAANLRFGVWAANRHPVQLGWEDRVEQIINGLYKAADKFDVEQDTKFITYAKYWIDQHIWRAARKHARELPLLHAPIGDDDGAYMLGDHVLRSEEEPPEEAVHRAEVRSILMESLTALTKQERIAIEKIFLLDGGTSARPGYETILGTKTLGEVAKEMNISRSRVDQLQQSALEKLRGMALNV